MMETLKNRVAQMKGKGKELAEKFFILDREVQGACTT